MTPPTASKVPPIAILGAGPSGLTLARLLEISKIDYIIYERDGSPELADRGGTLDLHAESGQLVLKQAGLFDEFKKIARYEAVSTIICDKKGNVAASFDQGEADRPEIDRKLLRQLLLESVPSERILWGHKVTSVQKEKDGKMSVSFVNGKVERGFSLVVGADGCWSRARSLITTQLPQYAGSCYLISSILTSNPEYPSIEKFAGHGTYMTMGDAKQIVAQRQCDGSYMVMAALQLPEHWKAPEDFDSYRETMLKDYFAGWSENSTNLIKYSEGPVKVWPLYGIPAETLPFEHVEGVTLVGDAAHVTPPSGEGVNLAMFDSYQLATQIIERGLDNLDAATRAYEEEMFPRAEEAITQGDIVWKDFNAKDAPYCWLDRMMKQHANLVVGQDEKTS